MEVLGIDDGPEVATIGNIHAFHQAESTTSICERLNCRGPSEDFSDSLDIRDISSQISASHPPLIKRKYFLLSSIIFILITVGLIITIAVVLTQPRKNPILESDTASKNEALSGTGIVSLQLGTSSDYTYHLYYQHSTGEIRDLELNNYQWVPAANTNVGLPSSVRNGTPMAVASSENSAPWPTYHIFYIDSSGILQEIFNTGGRGEWQSGTLGTLNVRPSTSSSVGLAACSNERWDGANMTANDRSFHLYYGDDDNLVHELQYNLSSLEWTPQTTFANTNGNAGIACSASDSNLSYVFLSNKQDKLELWWRDGSHTGANCAKHSFGAWNKVPSSAPPSIHPNTSISRIRISNTGNILFFQDPSYAVKALQPIVAAENSTWGSLLDVGSAVAAPASHMATNTFFQGNFSNRPSLSLTEDQAESGFHLFLQERGNDIVEYVRSYNGGQWTSDSLPNL